MARGIVAYSDADAARIMGRRSAEIAELLGFRGRDEMIHRDDLVLLHTDGQACRRHAGSASRRCSRRGQRRTGAADGRPRARCRRGGRGARAGPPAAKNRRTCRRGRGVRALRAGHPGCQRARTWRPHAPAELSAARLERLQLDAQRVEAIAHGHRGGRGAARSRSACIAAQWQRPNGLHIRRVRVPLGVIGIIYESRPNVTADAGALCLKSGNAVILRGGSDSPRSSAAMHACLVRGPAEARAAGGLHPAGADAPTARRSATCSPA